MSKNLPSITSDIPRDLRNFVDRLREMVNGSGAGRLLSAKDLTSSGLASLDGAGNLIPVNTYVAIPPAPTGVTASAAIDNVIVDWDVVTYNGHAYAEVWGASTNNIATAVLLGQTPGFVYTDPLGPGATRYYWVRYVNTNNEAGPYNALSGVSATTPLAVDYALSLLTGKITESQLYVDLGNRINLIDGTGAGSVNARIAVEATTRSTETDSLFAKYTVKIDNNGYVSGFGLASTANNATPYSSFVIRADNFSVASPSGPGITPIVPFVVNTTVQTINGVSVPIGVYMDAAFIKNGTITNAKIGDAAIDNAKIANAAITSAKIADANITTAKIADANISTAKIANAAITSALIADANITTAKIADANISTAKIANAAITTALIADANITAAKIADANITNAKIANAAITAAKIGDGEITNAKIGNVIQSSNYSAGSAGWQINKTGSAEFSDVVIRNRNFQVASGVLNVYTTQTSINTEGASVVVDGETYYMTGIHTVNTGFVSEPWFAPTEVYSLVAGVYPDVSVWAGGGNYGGEYIWFVVNVSKLYTQWRWNGSPVIMAEIVVYARPFGGVYAFSMGGIAWKLHRVT